MGANKTLLMKKRLGKKQRQNRPLPNWYRYKTDNAIRYNAKRRHWRRTKLKIYWSVYLKHHSLTITLSTTALDSSVQHTHSNLSVFIPLKHWLIAVESKFSPPHPTFTTFIFGRRIFDLNGLNKWIIILFDGTEEEGPGRRRVNWKVDAHLPQEVWLAGHHSFQTLQNKSRVGSLRRYSSPQKGNSSLI